MGVIKDISGFRSGRLVAKKVDSIKNNSAYWVCECDCGKTPIIRSADITSGHTKSCGCLHRERLMKGNIKHGKHQSTAYKAWSNILTRCLNENATGYKNYGGRGITVCEEWKSFDRFYSDMGDPEGRLQIDRINNDLGYFKGNCRWITAKENMRNTSKSIYIEHAGEKKCLQEWAEDLGIKPMTLWQRLFKLGWSVERALTEKVGTTTRKGIAPWNKGVNTLLYHAKKNEDQGYIPNHLKHHILEKK